MTLYMKKGRLPKKPTQFDEVDAAAPKTPAPCGKIISFGQTLAFLYDSILKVKVKFFEY